MNEAVTKCIQFSTEMRETRVQFFTTEKDNPTKIITSEVIIGVKDMEEVTSIIIITETMGITKIWVTPKTIITTPLIKEVVEILEVITLMEKMVTTTPGGKTTFSS